MRASCDALELLDARPPFTREHLCALEVAGLQFGAWDGRQPGCLNTDVVGLTSGTSVTRPGRIYRVDDATYFVELDARQPLPFTSGCVDWVYAEHVIEHITLDEAIGWLREVRRVLAPGGVVRLTTPDLGRYARAYVEEDGAFFEEHGRRLAELGAGADLSSRRAFMMNQLFQFYGHRWIYDWDELRHALGQAGFAAGAIARRAFRHGSLPAVACLDRAVRDDETIYVEAST